MVTTSNPRTQKRGRLRWIGPLLAVILASMSLAGLPAVYAQGGTPTSARLNGLRHVYQTWNNCSGANLTMALSYFGWSYDQDIARTWLKPNVEDKNVSPWELTGYVNHVQTSLPNVRAIWRYGGDLAVLKSVIAAGFPVIAESGFDVEDLGWMGHYETVVAFDDASQTLWIYDSYLGNGDGSGRTESYAEFDKWWRHFDRAYVVLFPLDRDTDLRVALGNYVDPQFAATSALDAAKRDAALDPNDGWAWFNAGTSSAQLGNYHDAAIYFDEAFRHGMPYRLLWYMFGPYEAYWNLGRFNDVITLANNTEATTIYVEETNYWRGMAYAGLGNIDAALNEFNKALAFNPNDTAASDAIAALQNGTFWAPAPA